VKTEIRLSTLPKIRFGFCSPTISHVLNNWGSTSGRIDSVALSPVNPNLKKNLFSLCTKFYCQLFSNCLGHTRIVVLCIEHSKATKSNNF
jgi:hypothetical protein